ncbi:MAG: UDP-N-acetylmuramoyl-L-alanyl-D-glutamate--2,6-diaminopimelate ligase [Fimbriimonadales bacterium]
MQFVDLVLDVPGIIEHTGDAEIGSLELDSRRASTGSLFLCMPGTRVDGHQFIPQALAAGAEGAVVTDPQAYARLRHLGIAGALVQDAAEATWRLAKRLYGDPSKQLKMVGVTGTNGKTTVAWILNQVLVGLGVKSAYVGTLGATIDGISINTDLTTPFAPEINRLLAEFVALGANAVVMEVSSHALAQKRVEGIEFDVGVFTNLSQDHLDFHPDMAQYFQAKRRLFGDLPTTKSIVTVANVDDEHGAMLDAESSRSLSFGSVDADVRLVASEVWLDRLQFSFEYTSRQFFADVPIGSKFNVSNCLGAVAAAIALGHEPANIVREMSGVQAAPGRFESVPTGSDFNVIVDYAHTPEALEKLLQSVRELTSGRVVSVFGCGGDRDRTKRPKMGATASALSDVVFVTSDNPRTEDPVAIIADIMPSVKVQATVDADRKSAIRSAIAEASSGDVVVIAGKGHEDYQILGTSKIHFDDREVAAEAIAERSVCA